MRKYLQPALLAYVFIWFFFGGIGHFALTHFFVSIVPPYIPHPLAMVYISGVAELAGALGLLYRPLRHLAGLGLFLLTVAVTPANVHMWMHPELFPDLPQVVYAVRLIVQVFLLWAIWWSTIRPSQTAAH